MLLWLSCTVILLDWCPVVWNKTPGGLVCHVCHIVPQYYCNTKTACTFNGMLPLFGEGSSYHGKSIALTCGLLSTQHVHCLWQDPGSGSCTFYIKQSVHFARSALVCRTTPSGGCTAAISSKGNFAIEEGLILRQPLWSAHLFRGCHIKGSFAVEERLILRQPLWPILPLLFCVNLMQSLLYKLSKDQNGSNCIQGVALW